MTTSANQLINYSSAFIASQKVQVQNRVVKSYFIAVPFQFLISQEFSHSFPSLIFTILSFLYTHYQFPSLQWTWAIPHDLPSRTRMKSRRVLLFCCVNSSCKKWIFARVWCVWNFFIALANWLWLLPFLLQAEFIELKCLQLIRDCQQCLQFTSPSLAAKGGNEWSMCQRKWVRSCNFPQVSSQLVAD